MNGLLTKSDETCSDGWICEHRWRQIYNMNMFRNVADDEPVTNWYDNGWNMIAFSRGTRAFIAINNDVLDMDFELQTDLPSGQYCDVISGVKVGSNSCTGKILTVDSNGTIRVVISGSDENPMIAIHIGSKL